MRIYLVSLLIGLMAASCSEKNGEDNPPEVPAGPVTTEKGAPLGGAVSKLIGAEGGTLSLPDNSVVVTVPAGAVAAATTFSVQPVESMLQPVEGKVSYELLPHDVTFAKPVSIKFAYDPELFMNEDVLVMGCRSESGKWIQLPTALDKAAKTVTVEKTSFSVFELFEKYAMQADKDVLMPGEVTAIKIGYLDHVPESVEEELLAPLVPYYFTNSVLESYRALHTKDVRAIRNWRVVSGPGALKTTNGLKSDAELRAPDPLKEDGVALVEATIDGVVPIADPKAPGGRRLTGQLILRTEVEIMDGLIEIWFDGKYYKLRTELSAGQIGDFAGIGGITADERVQFSVSIHNKGGKAINGGKFGDWTKPGLGLAVLHVDGVDWSTSWHKCGDVSSGAEYNTDSFAYTWLPGTGQPATGSINTQLHRMTSVCDHTSKSVKVQWKIPSK